jgi:hypothetical protein
MSVWTSRRSGHHDDLEFAVTLPSASQYNQSSHTINFCLEMALRCRTEMFLCKLWVPAEGMGRRGC